MPEPDLIELFVRPLTLEGVRYLVSGSVAAMLYGEPRVTLDIDLVVFFRPADLPRLAELYPSPAFYVPPADVIAVEAARERRGHFNIIHVESGLKADFYTANRDELHAWAFRRARHYTIGSLTVTLAPPEYVLLRKLEFFREGRQDKHIRDLRFMLAVTPLDRRFVAVNIERLGLQAEWDELLEAYRLTGGEALE